jgi:hypothetical protein
MTPKQQYRYWFLWGKACEARGWEKGNEGLRHAMHIQALGCNMSHKDMDNREVDRVFKTLELLADPDNLDAVLFFENPDREEKKRLLWRIDRTASKRYIQSISADKFGTIHYEDLDRTQLEQLRNTLTNRMRAHKKQEAAAEREQPVNEMQLALA